MSQEPLSRYINNKKNKEEMFSSNWPNTPPEKFCSHFIFLKT